jgi:hypothetical protein
MLAYLAFYSDEMQETSAARYIRLKALILEKRQQEEITAIILPFAQRSQA